MKRVLIAVLVVATALGAWADVEMPFVKPPLVSLDFGDQVSGAEVAQLIDILDHKAWGKQGATVVAIAEKLPIGARYALYDKYTTQGFWGLLNLYGVGSFVQGDPGTSLISLGGLLTLEVTATFAVSPWGSGPTKSIWVTSGIAVAAGAYLYGLIRPWFYAEERNRQLRSELLALDGHQ